MCEAKRRSSSLIAKFQFAELENRKSPGVQVPPSEEQKRRMEQLKKYDVMIPPVFFEQIAPVLAVGEEKYGVELNVHVGKGMMHCWGAMEFVPEAKAVRQEYFRTLR